MAELDELFGNEKQTTIEPYSKDDWIKQRNENRALAYEMLEAIPIRLWHILIFRVSLTDTP